MATKLGAGNKITCKIIQHRLHREKRVMRERKEDTMRKREEGRASWYHQKAET